MTTRPNEQAEFSQAAASAAGASKSPAADEPLDAIVYDVHPALAERPPVRIGPGNDYPYSSDWLTPPEMRPATSEQVRFSIAVLQSADRLATRLVALSDRYFAAVTQPAEFMVPKTFGMSAILGMMTTLAVVFGFLRWLDSYPVFYFFFAVEALGICLAQMLYGQAPRLASIVMGSVLLPGFTIIALLFSSFGPQDIPAAGCLIIGFVPLGAFLGYLTGTCAAGTFLVMEYVEPYLQGRGIWRARGG